MLFGDFVRARGGGLLELAVPDAVPPSRCLPTFPAFPAVDCAFLSPTPEASFFRSRVAHGKCSRALSRFLQINSGPPFISGKSR